VNYILKDGGIDVVITDEELAVHALTFSRRPQLKMFQVEEFSRPEIANRNRKSQIVRAANGTWRDHLHVGTTGRPKGAMLSHATCCTTWRAAASCWDVQADRLRGVPLFTVTC